MDTHSSERKSIRHTGCQTDSTLFAQFICHSNETAMDLTSPLSISSLKWRFSPKASSKLLLSSGLCPNFYKLLCVRVCVCVIFAFVPAGVFMDSNTLVCLDLSPALERTCAPAEPKTRREQVLLYIQRQIGLKQGGCRLSDKL